MPTQATHSTFTPFAHLWGHSNVICATLLDRIALGDQLSSVQFWLLVRSTQMLTLPETLLSSASSVGWLAGWQHKTISSARPSVRRSIDDSARVRRTHFFDQLQATEVLLAAGGRAAARSLPASAPPSLPPRLRREGRARSNHRKATSGAAAAARHLCAAMRILWGELMIMQKIC